jgi:hypothetical protein
MTLCEGGTLPDVKAKLRRDFWPTFSAELAVWPVVQVGRGLLCRAAAGQSACRKAPLPAWPPSLWQAANFKLLPVQYQLLCVNMFTILGELGGGEQGGRVCMTPG